MKLAITTGSFLLLLLLSKPTYAQLIGCQAPNSTVIYTENLLGLWGGTPLNTICSRGSTRTTPYAANVRVRANRPCNINLLGAGNEVYYNIAYCPLDDYLMLFGGGLSILAIRTISRKFA